MKLGAYNSFRQMHKAIRQRRGTVPDNEAPAATGAVMATGIVAVAASTAAATRGVFRPK